MSNSCPVCCTRYDPTEPIPSHCDGCEVDTGYWDHVRKIASGADRLQALLDDERRELNVILGLSANKTFGLNDSKLSRVVKEWALKRIEALNGDV